MQALNQVTSQIVLVPAYGRKYKNKEAAVVDWYAGKDFKIDNGPYTSIRNINYLKETSSGVYISWGNGYVAL